MTTSGQPLLVLFSGWFYYPEEFYVVQFNKISRENWYE